VGSNLAPMKLPLLRLPRSAAALLFLLVGCETPSSSMPDAAVRTDDVTLDDAGRDTPSLDADLVADAASPDAQGMPDAMLADSAIEAASPDAMLADAGPRTDFTHPTGPHEVCYGVGCYVEPHSGDWGFSDVVAVADDAFWIVGDRGIAFLEGGAYTYLDPIAPHPLNAIDGSPRDLWAVGDSGTALHFDGERWTRVATGTSSSLSQVFVADDGRAFAVGERATALEWVSGAWRPIALGLSSTPDLYGVSEAAGELWMVGADRTVLHRVGGVVTALDRAALLCSRSFPGENIAYRGVYAAGPGDAFISGRCNMTSVNLRHDVLVRAVGGAISCADQPAFYELDGTSATDVWGATYGQLEWPSDDADTLAHWDGFDWTSVRAPAQGRIALAGPHRAVALVGDDRAHVAVTDGTTVTPVGDDYRNQLTNVTALDASPTGAVYFQNRDGNRTTLVRRGRDGAWQTLTSGLSTMIHTEVLDDEHAWWWTSDLHGGVADGTGNLSSFDLPPFTSEVLPLSLTTALVSVGTSAPVVSRFTTTGSRTPLADTRPIAEMFMMGTQIMGAPATSGSTDSSILRLAGDAWTTTTLMRCTGVASIASFDAGAWSDNGDCVIHLRADGSSGTSSFPSALLTGQSSPVVGLAIADTAYVMINHQVYRLHAGTWSATTLSAGTATLRSVAVDREYAWFYYDTGILRARHDAL